MRKWSLASPACTRKLHCTSIHAIDMRAAAYPTTFLPARRRGQSRGSFRSTTVSTVNQKETDVVVIGAGIGGLSAGAVLAAHGVQVTVLESHSVAGGAAHAWQRDGYIFESGPSLWSGLGSLPSTNPLAHVLEAVGESVEVRTYSNWMCHMPDGDGLLEPGTGQFLTEVGSEQFTEVLRRLRGDRAAAEWTGLKDFMRPLATAATAVPPIAVRSDAGVLLTLGRYLPRLLKVDPVLAPKLLGPFSDLLREYDNDAGDPFVRGWLNLLCFLLSGATAEGTAAAEIGFMFDDWYRPNACLEYPVGGSGAVVEALARGLTKHGGKLQTNAHVEEILLEGGRAIGVRLRDGSTLRAKQAVISNASVWDTASLLSEGPEREAFNAGIEQDGTEECASFMHLHIGVDAEGLPPDLEMHHISLESWSAGVDAPQNLVLVSIPSVIDPSMAPPGKHVVHAYTPGSEPADEWRGLERGTPAYEAKKRERAEVLWRAVERAVPGARARCEIEMIGTPLTHARFLRRKNGTYGGTGWIKPGRRGSPPSVDSPIPGLLCVGDSQFPGPGVPAVASSGCIAANSLVSVSKHWRLLDRVTL